MKKPDETVRPDRPDRRDAQDQPQRHPRRVAEVLRARDLHPLLALINQAEPLCPTRLAACDPGDEFMPMLSFGAGPAAPFAGKSPTGASAPGSRSDPGPDPSPAPALAEDRLPCDAAAGVHAIGDQTAVRIEVLPVPGLGDAAYLVVLSPRSSTELAATAGTIGSPDSAVASGPADPRLLALGLTPRQADIVARLALGQSNKAIARELGIAPATVKKHLEDTYRRLGVCNRTEAALAARHALSAESAPPVPPRRPRTS